MYYIEMQHVCQRLKSLKPKTILANSTIDSMQAGLYYGVVGETKYMVQKMKEETGFDNMKVIATGGLGNMIAQTVDEIDYYDPTLTLKGLQIIYDKTIISKIKQLFSEREIWDSGRKAAVFCRNETG